VGESFNSISIVSCQCTRSHNDSCLTHTPYYTLPTTHFTTITGGDKPYLLSGADDRTVKIWDYQTKACLQTLEGHGHNVSSVCFHPRLPMIISASEDGTVRLWHR